MMIRIACLCLMVLMLVGCARPKAVRITETCEEMGYQKGSEEFLDCFSVVATAWAQHEGVSAANTRTLAGTGTTLMQMGQPRTLGSGHLTCTNMGTFTTCQ